jgi:hypothetical protein
MKIQGNGFARETVRKWTLDFLLCTLMFTLMFALIFTGGKAFAGPDDEAYFRQFLFQKITDVSDPDFPNISYHWLMAGFPFSVELNSTQDLIIQFSVFLYDNGTFNIMYKDFVQDKGATFFFPRACYQIGGLWSVPDKVLILKNQNGEVIMEGRRHQEYGQHRVLFLMTSGFPQSEVRGVNESFGLGQSQQEPYFGCY